MSTLPAMKAIPLSETVAHLAEASSQTLQSLIGAYAAGDGEELRQTAPLRVHVERADGAKADVGIPSAALPLLLSILRESGHGRGVQVVATDTECRRRFSMQATVTCLPPRLRRPPQSS